MVLMNLPISNRILMALNLFGRMRKYRLVKIKGIRKEIFYWNLKETEFRFNHRRDNLYLVLLKLLREEPI